MRIHTNGGEIFHFLTKEKIQIDQIDFNKDHFTLGCPYSLMTSDFIDRIIKLRQQFPDAVFCGFKEILQLPFNGKALHQQEEIFGKINCIENLLQAVLIAKQNPREKVFFIAIGFENAAISSSVAMIRALMAGHDNFYLLYDFKSFLSCLESTLNDVQAHNSEVLLSEEDIVAYTQEELTDFAEKNQINLRFPMLDEVKINEYKGMYEECFEIKEVNSPLFTSPIKQLCLKNRYSSFDANQFIDDDKEIVFSQEQKEIIKGKLPLRCEGYGEVCNPNSPQCPSMSSSKGICRIFHYIEKGF